MSLDFDFIALQEALAGQYSLERELGRGGMGVVYLAREVQLDRPAAIKVLPPSLAARAELRDLPDTVKRLEEEARMTRRRVDELNVQLADVGLGGDSGPGARSRVLERYGDAGVAERRRSAADELRAARDAAGQRLAAAVAALETIRLDLLRLQAGAGSVESLTAALDAVRRIGADVDVALAKRAEPGVSLEMPAR